MFLLPYLCMLGIVVSSSLIIPQSIKLFFKIASAYSSGDSDETFLFQFLVHFPYQLVGVGLEIPNSLDTSSAFTNNSLLMFCTSSLCIRKYVNVHVLIIHQYKR